MKFVSHVCNLNKIMEKRNFGKETFHCTQYCIFERHDKFEILYLKHKFLA